MIMLEDTHPVARRILIERWRAQTPAQRFLTAMMLSTQGRAFMLAGIRARRPGASPDELQREVERESFGAELAERVSAWRQRVRR